MSRVCRALAVPLLLSLAACQSAVGEDQAMTEGLRRSQECTTRLESYPGFAGIALHMPLGGTQATVAQRSDRSMPGFADRSALRTWRGEMAACRIPALEAAERFAPDSIWTLRRNYRSSDQVIDSLIGGRSTWGDANLKRDRAAVASWRAMWPETPEEKEQSGAAGLAADAAPESLAMTGHLREKVLRARGSRRRSAKPGIGRADRDT